MVPRVQFYNGMFLSFNLPAPCPSAWIESSSGTCVRRYNVKKSWEDARAICKEDGADLVKILDESMNVFIWGKDDT